MFSPFVAAQGHDTTFIKRLTVEEYLKEVQDEEDEVRGDARQPPLPLTTTLMEGQQRDTRRYEGRRAALTSRNPNVVFSSKYPSYDRLGRELCVAFQMQDMAVQQELRRLEQDGGVQMQRRSGVRLSAELPLGSSTSSRSQLASTEGQKTATKTTASSPEYVQRTERGYAATAVEVSPSSQYMSSSFVSRTSAMPSSHAVSSRRSDFTIYRDSGVGSEAELLAVASVRKSIAAAPPPHGKEHVGAPCELGTTQRAISLPPMIPSSTLPERVTRSHSEAIYPSCRKPKEEMAIPHGIPSKRRRSRSSGGCPTRVRFLPSFDTATEEGPAVVIPTRGAVTYQRPPTPPPTTTMATTAPGAATDREGRWTTFRESDAIRTTKQLFRSTTQGPHGTTALAHSQLIPCSAYGTTASCIPANKVQSLVERDINDAVAAMPSHQYITLSCSAVNMPNLCSGEVIQLGEALYKLKQFHVVAEVYEAVLVRNAENMQNAEALPEKEKAAAVTPPANDTAPSGSDTGTSGPVRQYFIYRWRSSSTTQGVINEAQRAALGLSLCSSSVTLQVTSCSFADGGLSLIALPPHTRTVPLSGLPLSIRSYGTVLKMVLKTLSAMVARRTIHGALTALGDIFLTWPIDSRDATAAGESENSASVGPLLFALHWERFVDFSAFVDRNAGRTLPFDYEDDSERPLVTYGEDLRTVMQLFLEHRLATELTSEQYVLLQKLAVMAAEPTQVANYLIQMNNLMATLPTDTTALQQSHDAAVTFYSHQ